MKINVYDFDKTIYNGNLSVDFYFFCLKKNFTLIKYLPVQVTFFLLYLIKIKTKKQFKEIFFSFLKEIKNLNILVTEFWKNNDKKIKKFYLSKSHDSDIIVSESPEFLLKPIGKKLKIKDVIATKINKKSGKLESENCCLEEKLSRYNKKYNGIKINNFFTSNLSDIQLKEISNKTFIVNDNNIIPYDEYKDIFVKKNKNRVLNFLLIIFSVIFLLFPILTIYNINKKEFVILSILVMTLILILKKVKLIKNFKGIYNINKKYIPLIIFLLCFISKIVCVLIFNNSITQVSDFSNALERAKDLSFSGDYYQVASHYILYPKIVNLVFSIFGNSQLVALLFNSFILSFVPVFLYLIGDNIYNKKMGIIAALFYILWPSTMFYTLIFTPDHIAALLLVIAIYLYLKLYKKYDKINIKSILLSLLIGVVLALCIFFKNFSLVIFVAIAIYLILNFIMMKKILFKKIILFFVILLSFFLTKEALFGYCESLTNTKIIRNIIPCYLNVGLNSKGDGTYNWELYHEYFKELENNNYDYKKTNKIIMNRLIYDIKSNSKNLPTFMYNKSIRIFENDKVLLDWVNASTNNEKSKLFVERISKYSYIYYVLLSVNMTFSLIKNYKFKNMDLYFVFIIILGCSMMLMLVEAQGRYKYAFLPLFALVSAYNFSDNKKV